LNSGLSPVPLPGIKVALSWDPNWPEFWDLLKGQPPFGPPLNKGPTPYVPPPGHILVYQGQGPPGPGLRLGLEPGSLTLESAPLVERTRAPGAKRKGKGPPLPPVAPWTGFYGPSWGPPLEIPAAQRSLNLGTLEPRFEPPALGPRGLGPGGPKKPGWTP